MSVWLFLKTGTICRERLVKSILLFHTQQLYGHFFVNLDVNFMCRHNSFNWYFCYMGSPYKSGHRSLYYFYITLITDISTAFRDPIWTFIASWIPLYAVQHFTKYKFCLVCIPNGSNFKYEGSKSFGLSALRQHWRISLWRGLSIQLKGIQILLYVSYIEVLFRKPSNVLLWVVYVTHSIERFYFACNTKDYKYCCCVEHTLEDFPYHQAPDSYGLLMEDI